MTKNESRQNELAPIIYKLKKGFIGKMLIVVIFFFLLGFAINFPLNRTVKNGVDYALAKLVSCPISYQKLQVGHLIPSFHMSNVTINGSCFNLPDRNLNLDSLAISFYRPTIYPAFGVMLKGAIKQDKNMVDFYPKLSWKDNSVLLENGQIDGTLLSFFLRPYFQVDGNFNINALVSARNKNIKNAKLLIQSKNLSIPEQSFQIYKIPEIILKDLILELALNDNNLSLAKLILGNAASPVSGTLTGNVELNRYSVAKSRLNLKGDLRFSENFLQQYRFINLFLGKLKNVNGSYQINIRGTLDAPQIN